MKNKLFITVFISVVFSLIVIISTFTLFTVKNVNVDVVLYNQKNETVNEVNHVLSKLEGKNISFVKKEDVKNLLKDYTYFEVVNVEKKYPDKLLVSLKERVAKFYCEYESTYYVISSDGFVLESSDDVSVTESLVGINISGKSGNLFEIAKPSVGKYFNGINESEEKLSLSSKITKEIFSITQSVNILDCLSEIDVFNAYTVNQVDFKTKTSVVIQVFDVFNDGENKVNDALSAYNKSDDFAKADNYITLGEKDINGKYTIIWLYDKV